MFRGHLKTDSCFSTALSSWEGRRKIQTAITFYKIQEEIQKDLSKIPITHSYSKLPHTRAATNTEEGPICPLATRNKAQCTSKLSRDTQLLPKDQIVKQTEIEDSTTLWTAWTPYLSIVQKHSPTTMSMTYHCSTI